MVTDFTQKMRVKIWGHFFGKNPRLIAESLWLVIKPKYMGVNHLPINQQKTSTSMCQQELISCWGFSDYEFEPPRPLDEASSTAWDKTQLSSKSAPLSRWSSCPQVVFWDFNIHSKINFKGIKLEALQLHCKCVTHPLCYSHFFSGPWGGFQILNI